MDGLECLREGAGLISSCIRRLQQDQLSRQGEVPDTFGQDRFLEALRRISRSLGRLRPKLLCRLLDDTLNCLADLDGFEDSASMFRTLAQIQTRLERLAPAHVLSHLEDLAEVVQDVRPPGGFQSLSYHPSLAARLHKLHILPVLVTLEEVFDFMFSPTNIQQLHWLHLFLHPPHTAPPAA